MISENTINSSTTNISRGEMSSSQARAQLLSQANNQLLRIAYTSGRVTCRARAEGGASEGMTVEKLRKIGDLARAIVGQETRVVRVTLQ